jgi:hypothetical protein
MRCQTGPETPANRLEKEQPSLDSLASRLWRGQPNSERLASLNAADLSKGSWSLCMRLAAGPKLRQLHITHEASLAVVQ